jgi:serine-type D-Ala-D-Ala carboxypeptidase/endopeptidase (penicillin-binding protein 4)
MNMITISDTNRARIRPEHLAGMLISFLILLAGIPNESLAQPIATAKALASAIDAELRTPLMKRTICGIVVRDLESGIFLYERNADLLLRPASNTKLVTSGAALLVLPDTFRFRTLCFLKRTAPDAAELWIRGSGDPLFSTADMASMIAQLRISGARDIAAVHLDGSIFDSTYYGEGWMWDDETDPTMPFISAFPFARNRLVITVTGSGQIGKKAQVTVSPGCDSIVVRNQAFTGSTDNISVTRLPSSNIVRVWGTVKKGGSVKETISMWSPEDILACAFIDAASGLGLLAPSCTVDRMRTPDGLQASARIERTLDEVLAVLNKQSDNLCAESLLKALAAEIRREAGTAKAGLEIGKRAFADLGVDTASIALVDGSGISYYNLITPKALSDVLSALHRSRAFDRYVRSLAIPGSEGTLSSRFSGIQSSEDIHAKTGTLRGVSTLSGYVVTPDSPPLSFVIFMQNFTGPHRPYRELQDRIVRRCLEYSASRVRATRSR